MRRRMASILTTGAAMAAATALAVAPAVAAVPQTISIDNPNDPIPDSPAGTGDFTASAEQTVLTDVETGATFVCETENGVAASTASGVIESVTNRALPYTDVNAIKILEFNNCTGQFGPVTVEATPTYGPYELTIDEYPGTTENGSPANGAGYVHAGAGGTLATVNSGPCSFEVEGYAPAYYLNASNPANTSGTGELHLTADTTGKVLTAAGVGGCLGAVNNGDTLTYEAVYTIDDPKNPSITVTSP